MSTAMETLGLPSNTSSLSVSPHTLSSPDSPSSMDSNHPTLSHSHFDAFRPIGESGSARWRSDQSDPNDAKASPRTLPLSFRNLSVHEEDTDPSVSSSRSYGYPVLAIRKTSTPSNASLSREISHGSFISGTSPRRHRRRPSTEFSLSPGNARFSPPQESAEEASPTMADRNASDGSIQSYSSPVCLQKHCVDDSVFPGGLEMSNYGDDDEICDRHHHRQSVSSTVSITCSDHDDDDEEVQSLGEIEASVPLEPVAPSMLIPLVDRCDEMSDLLKHPANKEWVRLAQNTIGADVYNDQCLPLWVKTDRQALPDHEWLRRSKKLLTIKGCGGICDGRLWNDFCGMVGWDAGAPIDDYSGSLNHRSSRESLGSTSSGKMSSIAEEEEETGSGGHYRPSTENAVGESSRID